MRTQRSLWTLLPATLVALMAAAGCSTEFHYHETDAQGGGTGTVEPIDHDDPAEDVVDTGDEDDPPVDDTGDDGPDYPDVLLCPDGWQPNSTGEACAPICAEGTSLNDEETGCVEDVDEPADDTGGGDDTGDDDPTPVDRTECPEGYVPSGAGGGADELCVPVLPVTIHGVVIDDTTGAGVAGATVVLLPMDTPLTTDDAGYFKVEDVPYTGVVQATYDADGYEPANQAVEVPLEGGDGLKTLLVDASVALTPTVPTVDPPTGSHSVAGTIYAGATAAAGATVHLHNDTLGWDVATATAGDDGAFSFTQIFDDGYVFSLRVEAWDADGDGVSDYQYQAVVLGGLDHVNTELGHNLSNVIVVLEAVAKEIAWGSFLPPLAGVTGPETITGVQLAHPAADIVLHFGAETAPETLALSLYEVFSGALGDSLAVDLTWNEAGTVLTIDPAQPLLEDADPTTLYELRIDALLWADGSALVPLDAGPGGGIRVLFDVGAAPNLLPAPTPELHIEDLDDPHQTVAQVICDSRVCWKIDTDGLPFAFPADPADPAASDSYFNGASGLSLLWDAVPGAASYKVHARQAWTDVTPALSQGWHEVEAVITTHPDGTVTADGVLATGTPSWNDFGVGLAGGPVGNPLALSNAIELAVTPIDAQGHESPIDDDALLAVLDTMQIGIAEASPVVDDGDELELGHLAVGRSIDLRLSELASMDGSANWSLHSGRVLNTSQPDGVDWDADAETVVAGASDEGRFGPFWLGFRGVCTAVTADAGEGEDTVAVHDTSLLSGGGEVFFLNSSGSGLAHPEVRAVSNVDHAAGLVSFIDSFGDGGGDGLDKGEFVCLANELDGSSTPLHGSASSGDSILTVDNPLIFHPNQDIVIMSRNPDPVVMAAKVVRVREPVLSPQGFVVLPGEIDITPSLSFSRDEAVLMARPGPSEEGFRNAAELELSASISTHDVEVLPLTDASMTASTVMRGDLLLVDVDGVYQTSHDRHFVEVDIVHMELDNPQTGDFDPDFHVTLVPAPGESKPLPDDLFLASDTARIVHLADSFTITGLQDTSGNGGVDDERDQFSFCAAGDTPDCLNGVFVY